jgi:hypothetical protein
MKTLDQVKNIVTEAVNTYWLFIGSTTPGSMGLYHRADATLATLCDVYGAGEVARLIEADGRKVPVTVVRRMRLERESAERRTAKRAARKAALLAA